MITKIIFVLLVFFGFTTGIAHAMEHEDDLYLHDSSSSITVVSNSDVEKDPSEWHAQRCCELSHTIHLEIIPKLAAYKIIVADLQNELEKTISLYQYHYNINAIKVPELPPLFEEIKEESVLTTTISREEPKNKEVTKKNLAHSSLISKFLQVPRAPKAKISKRTKFPKYSDPQKHFLFNKFSFKTHVL
jgi:hypothetical protein